MQTAYPKRLRRPKQKEMASRPLGVIGRMKASRYFPLVIAYLVLGAAWFTEPVGAATPTAQQALRLVPVQPDVDYSRPSPEEAAKCTISAKKFDGKVGWVIEDANGVVLRKFLDTDGDNKVDQWCYFKDGLEVYRDIDSDRNGVADQFRWFNTAGTRWGVDKRETGKIDYWKVISAEEVTAEVVAALASRDAARFDRLVLTPAELKALGLGPTKSRQIADKIDGLEGKFRQLMLRQKEVAANTQWSQFSGGRPGVVPAATDGSTKDVHVYENVVAVTQTGDKHGQVQIGTLIQVGDVWRVIDVPQPLAADTQLTANGLFFQPPPPERTQTASDAPSEPMQKLLKELEHLDTLAAKAASREEQAKINAQRANVMVEIADQATKPEDRVIWLRQLADMISAAVQAGTFPDGPKLLATLFEKLTRNPADKDLAPYFKFRQLSAEYGQAIQAEGADFVKIQGQWLKKLEDYASTYPNSPDSAEAMLQLGIAQEYAGQEEECKKWYGRIVKDFPNSTAAKRASGARAAIRLRGPRDRHPRKGDRRQTGRYLAVPRQDRAGPLLGDLVRAVQGRVANDQRYARQVRVFVGRGGGESGQRRQGSHRLPLAERTGLAANLRRRRVG